MKTIAFVPIKLNSERTPGKNTRRFDDGKVLVTFFLETLQKVTGFDEVYVYCSDTAIRTYLPSGIRFLKRPEYLDTQQATPQDIISEFMKSIHADIYAVCHCTSPFVSRSHFKECIEAVKNGEFDSSFTAGRVQTLMWTSKNTPLNFEPSNIPRTQDLPVLYTEVPAIYVFRREVFEVYKRRVGLHPHITEVSEVESVDIDYPEDFEIANAIYMGIIKKRNGGVIRGLYVIEDMNHTKSGYLSAKNLWEGAA